MEELYINSYDPEKFDCLELFKAPNLRVLSLQVWGMMKVQNLRHLTATKLKARGMLVKILIHCNLIDLDPNLFTELSETGLSVNRSFDPETNVGWLVASLGNWPTKTFRNARHILCSA